MPVFDSSRPLNRGPAPLCSTRGNNGPVQITKLQGVDGFVVVDLDGASRSSGIVRSAKKILRDGAVNLARHLTYAYAVLGIEASGASAAVNAEEADRPAALDAFVEEVRDLGVSFDPGKGVTASQLEALAANDSRAGVAAGFRDDLLAVSLLTALRAVGDLDSQTVVSESPLSEAVQRQLESSGATCRIVEAGRLDEPCDVLIAGSAQGLIDHENAASVRARVVAPVAPFVVTTRGLAALGRLGATVIPDFVSLSGPLAAHWPAGDTSLDALSAEVSTCVDAAMQHALGHDAGPVVGAAEHAETFLSTWRDQLPFGRPI